jgi:hypothetical protein
MLKTCTVCAAEFHGRADAAYCSPACRQKAHRARQARDGGGPLDPIGEAALIKAVTDTFRPDRIERFSATAKLHMVGVLRRALGDVEASSAGDRATVPPELARKIAKPGYTDLVAVWTGL